MTWRQRPVIYEIATFVWLNELRAQYGKSLTLATIPAQEWDALAKLDVDAVWLMGVWERSPTGVAVSNAHPDLQAEFRRVLPDYRPDDNLGSAYCVRDYVVAAELGGPAALAQARAELNARGLRLVLDFVPNHVAIDHPWALQHPEYFIRGSYEDLARAPNDFVDVKGEVYAHGRDPYFPPWGDVIQVNAFNAGLRAAAIDTVTTIAAQCDGMRCDMAMLLLNDIFERTWSARAGRRPTTEYWQDLIPAVKAKHPDVLFIAEAYWDLEYELMQNGFDYCYDKRLYDRLVHDNAESVRAHLTAGLDYQDRLVRFIENHDEPRAAATFPGQKEYAAAVVFASAPGAKLIYDGQIEGRKVKLPVFLARRPPEPPDDELAAFYRSLLNTIHADLFHVGEWHLCDRHGWPDNASFHNIVAWTWRLGAERTLVVVNLSDFRSQARVRLPWDDLRDHTWRLVETLNWECYVRDGDELSEQGLFVELDPWRYHFLKFE
ncbi:MAG: alpha-amylase family glycosyl hydrolase [Rhodoplanes sp.]